jgi:hypothetical protein
VTWVSHMRLASRVVAPLLRSRVYSKKSFNNIGTVRYTVMQSSHRQWFPINVRSWHVSSQPTYVSFPSLPETFVMRRSLLATADSDQTSPQLWRLPFTFMTGYGRAVFHSEALLAWLHTINSSDTNLMWHKRKFLWGQGNKLRSDGSRVWQ